MATDLHFPTVVNGVLMPRKIVRPREDRVARLAGARIDPVTPMGSGLRIAQGQVWRLRGRYLSVAFSLVLLKSCRRVESQVTPVVRTRVSA